MTMTARIILFALFVFAPFGTSLAQDSPLGDEFAFDGPVFDIAATPSGSILVADFATVRQIGANGVRELMSLPVVEDIGAFDGIEPTFINGLAPTDDGDFFAARSGLDLAAGAALFEARPGLATTSRTCFLIRLLGGHCPTEETLLTADIEAFTLGNWPVNAPGQSPGWKDFDCEPPGGYSTGPQSNPYHIALTSPTDVLVADAAGNSLLHVRGEGSIELVATFDPVINPETDDRLILLPLDENTDCYVEPVPTSIAIGPDGAYYVGELIGSVPENFGGQPTPQGLASVWRIEPDAYNARCPSEQCTKVVTGLNSVIDIEFGPDGMLYVVEYERNGFLATVAPDLEIPLAGGSVKRCDVTENSCEVILGEDGTLFLPGAIAFDNTGDLWLLDNVFAPTVRRID
jgi:hypothetical protein